MLRFAPGRRPEQRVWTLCSKVSLSKLGTRRRLNVGQIGLKSLVDAVLTLELSPELETVAVSDEGAESNGVVIG
jgi:hypothetical protein